jgi:hypothetical protein
MNWGVLFSCGEPQRPWRALCAVLTLAIFGMSVAPVQAREKVTVSGRAQAVVLTTLSIIKVNDLVFGKIAARSVAGTVIANPVTQTCTVTGPIVRVGTCQMAVFAGRVGNRTTFKVEVQGNTTLRGPGGTIVLDRMTLAPGDGLAYAGAANPALAASGNVPLRVTTPTGMFTFRVGGTLHVNANQAPGVYTGTFSLQANYQ